jgi:hypothetical protein
VDQRRSIRQTVVPIYIDILLYISMVVPVPLSLEIVRFKLNTVGDLPSQAFTNSKFKQFYWRTL